jgi:hypothetical protein
MHATHISVALLGSRMLYVVNELDCGVTLDSVLRARGNINVCSQWEI